MDVSSALEDWLPLSTPLPWGVAFDGVTKTHSVVARTPEGAPRLNNAGVQIVIAQGLTQPDALVLIALRERYRNPKKQQRESGIVRSFE